VKAEEAIHAVGSHHRDDHYRRADHPRGLAGCIGVQSLPPIPVAARPTRRTRLGEIGRLEQEIADLKRRIDDLERRQQPLSGD
jgi:hypothetical protein